MPKQYWAISGLGYGVGSTPDEAAQRHLDVQRQNFPHLTEQQVLDDAWGWIWAAPEGASGFFTDGTVHWTFPEGRGPQRANEIDRIGPLGNVPDWAYPDYERREA